MYLLLSIPHCSFSCDVIIERSIGILGDGYDTETRTDSNPGSIPDIKLNVSLNAAQNSSFSLGVPLGPTRARSHDNIPSAIHDNDINDLKVRLQEVLKTKERLESERVGMLDSLCKQVEENDKLRDELEDLKSSRPSSRTGNKPANSITKTESFSSLSEKCPACVNTSKCFIYEHVEFCK